MVTSINIDIEDQDRATVKELEDGRLSISLIESAFGGAVFVNGTPSKMIKIAQMLLAAAGATDQIKAA